MLFDIVCPFCMARFAANNVVFRHNERDLRAAGRPVEEYRCADPYRKAYFARHGLPAGGAQDNRVVDPGYLPEECKTYSEGLLIRLRCAEGYQMEERLCPFCHSRLYASAGRLPMQQMAIIGATNSGKTTFEAAMIHQMTRSGMGCINNTLDETGRLDNVVQENVQLLLKRSGQRLGKLNQPDAGEWGATENYHGPYIFSVAPGGGAAAFSLAFYDLPGEHFRNNINLIKLRAPYIASAKTCLCLIDLNNIASVTAVIGALNTNFGDEMKRNGVNLALVLYKADLLYEAVNDIREVVQPLTVAAGAPLDMTQIEVASKKLENFVIKKDDILRGAYHAICSLLGEDNVRLFMAQAFDEEGGFAPRGCEVPLLWSLARQGLYPQKS